MKKRKLASLIALVIFIQSLCGCWNYKELSDYYFVSGFAIDYIKENDSIRFTVEVATPKVSERGFQLESLIFHETGENCFECIRNIIPKLGRKLNWSHSKVLILSTEVFKEESIFQDVVDFMDRTVETREDLWVIASKEKTAGEILTETDSKIHPIKSFLLNESLKNQSSLSRYEGIPIWKFCQQLSSPGVSATLPAVQFNYDNGNKIPLIWGEAIFKEANLVGWLDADAIKDKLMINGDYKGRIYSIDEDIFGKPVKAAIEIKNLNTKKITNVSGKQPTIDINIAIDAALVEINSNIDLTKEDQRKPVVEVFRKAIETQIQNFIVRIQNDYASDIFGFGNLIRMQHYKEWEVIEPKWQEIFPYCKTSVKVDIQLLGSSIKTKPREIGKKKP